MSHEELRDLAVAHRIAVGILPDQDCIDMYIAGAKMVLATQDKVIAELKRSLIDDTPDFMYKEARSQIKILTEFSDEMRREIERMSETA
jgi:hypothetical protein